MADAREPEVLIVGAGPSGLAIGACLRRDGVEARIIDRHGVAGGAYSRMYERIILSSPASYLGLPGVKLLSDGTQVSAAEYAAYLARYAAVNELRIEKGNVTSVARRGGCYEVRVAEDSGTATYHAVVAATGMCDNPVVPVIPGLGATATGVIAEPVVLNAQDWRGPQRYAGKRVLIIGGGMRGIELAEECAGAGLTVTLSARHGTVSPRAATILGVDVRLVGYPILRRLPLALVRRTCANGWYFAGVDRSFSRLRDQGRIVVRPEVANVSGSRVRFVDGSGGSFDVIIVAAGYCFDMAFLPDQIPRARQGYPLVRRGQPAGFSNLFILGVPCAFRADSQFIHGAANDALHVANTIAR